MTQNEVLDQVKKFLGEQLRKDMSNVTLDSRIKEDLGADSLDIMTILMDIEEENGITIPDEELTTMSTVGDIVRYMTSLPESK